MMDATEYNAKVWASAEMVDAKRSIKLAGEELDTGEGWGRMPLEAARAYLRSAISGIEIMMNMDGEDHAHES